MSSVREFYRLIFTFYEEKISDFNPIGFLSLWMPTRDLEEAVNNCFMLTHLFIAIQDFRIMSFLPHLRGCISVYSCFSSSPLDLIILAALWYIFFPTHFFLKGADQECVGYFSWVLCVFVLWHDGDFMGFFLSCFWRTGTFRWHFRACRGAKRMFSLGFGRAVCSTDSSPSLCSCWWDGVQWAVLQWRLLGARARPVPVLQALHQGQDLHRLLQPLRRVRHPPWAFSKAAN